MNRNAYFRGPSGTRHTYAEVADRIRQEAPHTLGQHIFAQLRAIGLYDEFMNGATPCALPFTFAAESRLVQKKLTSSAMFHTPGLFRALRNDYRIKGEPRRRAVKILSDGYGLPQAEAEGLLSGAIISEIDETAGTITYAIAKATEPCPASDPGSAPLIIRSGETAAGRKIVVPPGVPLIEGRLYLQLYHGRKAPADAMQDRGFVGPTFGPLASVAQTYLTQLRLHGDGDVELWLEVRDDMIVWDGEYYGDMSIFIASGAEHG